MIDRLQAHRYKAIEFYRVLIAEKKGLPITNYDEKRKRSDMKLIMRRHFKTEDIEKISYNQLKTEVNDEPLLTWCAYRLWLSRNKINVMT